MQDYKYNNNKILFVVLGVDLYPQKTGLKVGRFCLSFIDKGLLNKNIKDNFVFKFC